MCPRRLTERRRNASVQAGHRDRTQITVRRVAVKSRDLAHARAGLDKFENASMSSLTEVAAFNQ